MKYRSTENELMIEEWQWKYSVSCHDRVLSLESVTVAALVWKSYVCNLSTESKIVLWGNLHPEVQFGQFMIGLNEWKMKCINHKFYVFV